MRAHLPAMLATCLLAGTLPGCISYSLDRLPPAPPLPAPRAPDLRPTLACTVTTQAAGGGQTLGGVFETFGPVVLNTELPNTLLASGQFRSVAVGPGEAASAADLHLDLVLTVDASDMIELAAMLTLFIVPTWRTVTFDLTAEVRAKDGRWQRYHLVDGARDVQWLPIILGMSFAPWGEVYPAIRENMCLTLLADLQADGFLATPSAP